MPSPDQDPIQAWRSIVGLVRALADGRSDAELDRRAAPDAFTRRELVHHVVEANVVAASIVVAGLGSPGCVYDWSWMQPFGPWLERLDYTHKPIGPALRLLEALNDYVVALVEPLPDGLRRVVRLRDEAGGEPRATTVGEVLLQEAAHAREHAAAGEP